MLGFCSDDILFARRPQLFEWLDDLARTLELSHLRSAPVAQCPNTRARNKCSLRPADTAHVQPYKLAEPTVTQAHTCSGRYKSSRRAARWGPIWRQTQLATRDFQGPTRAASRHLESSRVESSRPIGTRGPNQEPSSPVNHAPQPDSNPIGEHETRLDSFHKSSA